jgi:hypothetical protein
VYLVFTSQSSGQLQKYLINMQTKTKYKTKQHASFIQIIVHLVQLRQPWLAEICIYTSIYKYSYIWTFTFVLSTSDTYVINSWQVHIMNMIKRSSFCSKYVNVTTNNISSWSAPNRRTIFTVRTDIEYRNFSTYLVKIF